MIRTLICTGLILASFSTLAKDKYTWKLEVFNTDTKEEKYYSPSNEYFKLDITKDIFCTLDKTEDNARFFGCISKKDLPLKFSTKNYVACNARNNFSVIHVSFIKPGGKFLTNNYVVSLNCVR